MKGFAPQRLLSLLFIGILIGVVGGCDATSTNSESNDVRSQNGSEVLIEEDSFTRADLQFEPLSMGPGQTFSISLTDEDVGQNVTSIVHEGTEDGHHELTARFDPLQPASVSVECRNQNEGTSQKIATLGAKALQARAKDGPKEEPMDITDGFPSSFHYIDYGSHVIVEVDYGGTNPGAMVNFPSESRPMECTHVSFRLEDVSTQLSADGVRFQGLDQAPTFRHRQFR